MANDKTYIRISGLIQQQIKGELDEPEQKELEQWLAEDPGNQAVYGQLLNDVYRQQELQHFSKYDEEAAYERFTQNFPDHAKPSRRRFGAWVAAASILLVCSAGGYFLLHSKQETQQTAELIKNDIAPGHNQATLTLANGKKIVLTKGLSGVIATQGRTTIQATNNNIAYNSTQNRDQLNYNTLSTAKGEQSPYPLILADGTKVWLNAESSITFPTTFTGKERIVKLTGEAYFEVKHNERQGFKVITASQTVEDIGTTFNIKAYADEPAPATTLVEGSVKVNGDLLKPGEEDLDGSIKTANLREVLAWKDGFFRFNDASITTIMRELARWYDIEVVYEGPIPQEHFTAKISKYKNISAVLHILEKTKGVHFKIEGRRITVSSKS